MTSPDQNYTSWHKGMKVVFVGWPSEINRTSAGAFYQVGDVYTVDGIKVRNKGDLVRTGDGSAFYLSRDAVYIKVGGRWMIAEGFRPVQTRKTDISIFTAMLSPKPAKAKKVRA